MFTSFDENSFWQAIHNKDYRRLKNNVISAILNDPTFARCEIKEILNILDDNVPEIFEKYSELDFEERKPREEWDKRYFTKLTYWFEENFSKERISHIKEVGRTVHQDTAKKYTKSMAINSKPSTEQKSVANNIPQSKQKVNAGNFLLAGLVIAIVALLIIGIVALI